MVGPGSDLPAQDRTLFRGVDAVTGHPIAIGAVEWERQAYTLRIWSGDRWDTLATVPVPDERDLPVSGTWAAEVNPDGHYGYDPVTRSVVAVINGPVNWTYQIPVGDLLDGITSTERLPPFLTAGLDMSFKAPLVPGKVFILATLAEIGDRQAVVEVKFKQRNRVCVQAKAKQNILRGDAMSIKQD